MSPIQTTGSSWKKWAILFLASQNVSLFGSSVTGLAIIWHVTLQTSSGTWMMLIVMASMLPQVFVSLWAGVWADRYNRKHCIMAADAGIALATLALALAYMSGYGSLELLLAIAAVRSFGAGVQTPAVNAVIPQLVPADQLTRFNGLNQSLNAAMQLLAPAAGGLVLATFGLGWAFMLDVATAILAVGILRFVPLAPAVSREDAASAWQGLRRGIAFAWSRPLIKRLIITYGVAFILITPAAFLTPVMLERKFGNDVWLLTIHEIVWTAGTLVGGAVIVWLGSFRNKVRVIAFSLVAFGVTFAFLGLAATFSVYLLFMGVAGLVLPFFTTAETVLVQETVPPHMLGRVFSLLQITALAAMPLAMLAFGPLADALPIDGILVVTGFLLAVVGFLFLPSGKLLDDPVER